jgi:hypothetical protein
LQGILQSAEDAPLSLVHHCFVTLNKKFHSSLIATFFQSSALPTYIHLLTPTVSAS